jgi:hypothetical protein
MSSVLEPSNHAAIYALQGSLAGFPLEKDLAQERQAEQERENKRWKNTFLMPTGSMEMLRKRLTRWQ